MRLGQMRKLECFDFAVLSWLCGVFDTNFSGYKVYFQGSAEPVVRYDNVM